MKEPVNALSCILPTEYSGCKPASEQMHCHSIALFTLEVPQRCILCTQVFPTLCLAEHCTKISVPFQFWSFTILVPRQP